MSETEAQSFLHIAGCERSKGGVWSNHNLFAIVSIVESNKPSMEFCGLLMGPCRPLLPMVPCESALKRLCWGIPKEENSPDPSPTPTPPSLQTISVQNVSCCHLLSLPLYLLFLHYNLEVFLHAD